MGIAGSLTAILHMIDSGITIEEMSKKFEENDNTQSNG